MARYQPPPLNLQGLTPNQSRANAQQNSGGKPTLRVDQPAQAQPEVGSGAPAVDPEQLREEAKLNTQLAALRRNYKQALRFRELTGEGVDPYVIEAMEGQTLKLANPFTHDLDTGVPLHPKAVSMAIGVGDQIGDVWRGIAQGLKELGVADLIDTEVQDQNEQIIRDLYADNRYGGSAMAGAVVGAVAEPIGLAIPFGKLTTAANMAKASILGGLYGSALYVDGEESRLKNAALGAAGTALLSGAYMGGRSYLVQRFNRHANGAPIDDAVNNNLMLGYDGSAPGTAKAAQIVQRQAEEKFQEYSALQARASAQAEDLIAANPEQAKRASAILQRQADAKLKEYEKIQRKLERQANNQIKAMGGKPDKNKRPKSPKENRESKPPTKEETMVDLEVRASAEGARHVKIGENKRLFNQVVMPIYDNIAQYNKKLAAKLRDADFWHHRTAKVWTDRTQGFNDWFNKLDDTARARMSAALSEGLTPSTIKLMQELGGGMHASHIKDVLKDVLTRYRKAGYKIDDNDSYFPTAVKQDSLEFVQKRHMDRLDKIVAKEEARLKRKLTSKEQAHVMERLVSFDIRYSNTSGNLKGRKIPEQELDYYHDPVTALHYYIASAAEDIAKRDFFRGFGYKPKKDTGLDVTGADIMDSINSIVDVIKKEIPDFAARKEVINLLSSRFSADVHKTHRYVQALKNLSYASTLGNFWSAMTQIGDLVFAAHKYGIANTVATVLKAKVVSKEDLGITKAMQELNSARGITSKLVDWSFLVSGFKLVDDFGKNVNINASLRKNKQLAISAPDKFRKKWGVHFGDQTDSVIHELQTLELNKGRQNVSDNINLLMWNDLASTQPIGLSEVPKKYLDMPNGRVVYAYKTFAMKQFAYLRNTLTDPDRNKFQRGYDAMYFATLFVMANSSVDAFKDYMSGKDSAISDHMLDNLISMVGSSKYDFESGKGLPLGTMIYKSLEPVPLTQLRDATNSLGSGGLTPGKAINTLPLVGKINRDREIIE